MPAWNPSLEDQTFDGNILKNVWLIYCVLYTWSVLELARLQKVFTIGHVFRAAMKIAWKFLRYPVTIL